MATNNFKLLEEEMEAKFENASEAIKKNVYSRKDLWTLLGDLFDLYIPRIFSTIIGGSVLFNSGSGKSEEKD